MQREIEFRYTVKRENGHRFAEVFTLKQIEQGEALKFIELNHAREKDVTKEQYTTRKDSKGKEIYEGDNLQYGDSPIYTVTWQTDRWMMCGTKNGNGFCVEIPGYMEIIGNIDE